MVSRSLSRALATLAGGRAQQENDPSLQRALCADATSLGLPDGLSLEWLGTAGFRLRHAGTTILIDPYLSRPSARAVLSRAPLRAEPALLARHLGDGRGDGRVDAILIGHTHFDHALDVPELARTHGCSVHGSSSLRWLMGLHGLVDRAHVMQPGRAFEVGPFRITFVESRHSPLLLGLAVPSGGELTCDHLCGLHAGAYRCGQVYGIHVEVAGRTFYHQGSADLLEDALARQLPPAGVEYFLCGIAGRRFSERYVARVLRALGPRVIIPHHHDDFLRPLDDELAFSFNVNLGGFVEEVRAVSGDFSVRTLPRAAGGSASASAERVRDRAGSVRG